MRKIFSLAFMLLFFIAFSSFSSESVLINYTDDAQVEIVSKDLRILIDVGLPTKVTSNNTYKEEVLLSTHHHSDHYNNTFVNNFKGKQIDYKSGELKGNGYFIKSIPSYHDEKDRIVMVNPTNFIFIIDVAGLRIAHFGAVGVDAFSKEELNQFGQIDIAIMQLGNPSSSMDAKNDKAFKLMAQVKPKLVIPTHSNKDVMEKAVKLWSGKYYSGQFLEMSKDKLPKSTSLVIMGDMSKTYSKIFNLSEYK